MKTTDATSGAKTPSDKKAPGFWFYTADFEKDMQILSLSAQGLWARMLCWMHENEAHRGFLELPTGEPMNEQDISSKVGKPPKQVQSAIAEMARVGIFSRDDRGCIFNRRMARDTHISDVRRQAAKQRMETANRAANGSFAGDFAGAKQPGKLEQNPTVTASVSVSVSDSIQHHAPAADAAVEDSLFSDVTPINSPRVVRPDVPAENPEEARVLSTAKRLTERHPRARTCGPAEAQRALKAIVGKLPKSERAAKLEQIDRNHEAWCKSEAWTKDGGEYAKGLANWLAPTMGRFNDPPPARASPPVNQIDFRDPKRYFDPRTITG